MTNIQGIQNLIAMLGVREVADVVLLAKKQTKLERHWARVMADRFAEITSELLVNAARTGRLAPELVDFVPVVMEHSFAVIKAGIESTATKPSIRRYFLAKPPPAVVPRSMKSLQLWWDHYRRDRRVPARQRQMADKIKKAYLKNLEKVWLEASADFLSGNTARHTAAIEAIQKQTGVAYSRAKMIVETETTYYFNKARRQIYDQSPDVTHYLFVAIRDARTTRWCNSRQGLVYTKGDPLLVKETPPIHWYCRSEMLPLLPLNPAHLLLIQDKSRSRRRHRCEPLPPGWNQSRSG